MTDESDLEYAHITITLTLHEDSSEPVHDVDTSDDLPLVTALGMLDLARASLISYPPVEDGDTE